MREPIRLAILKSLTKLLAAEYGTDENGQPFDLRNKVFRGRNEFGTEYELPMLSILEHPRPGYSTNAGENEARLEPSWDLLLQGWAKDDLENPTDPAHWLMAAVVERLGLVTERRSDGSNRPKDAEAYMLGFKNTVVSFDCGPGVVRPADKTVSSKAFFYLPVRIGLAVGANESYRSI